MSLFSDAITRMDGRILAVHGTEVEYRPRVGETYTLTGVLDSGAGVEDRERVRQTLWAPLSSFTAGEPARGDLVIIGDETYQVRDVERQHFDSRLLRLSVTHPQ